MVDLVLSSGYLAFARQSGFLAAVEELGVSVDAVCGTSSGAIAGSMFAAGYTAAEIADELSSSAPIATLRPSWAPWNGLFAVDGILDRLRRLLPARFEDLERPLGLGVITLDYKHVLLTNGPLPEAVVASCAIPMMFTPIQIDGTWYADGGPIDRTAIGAWRAWRGERPTLVHLVERSLGSKNPPELGDLPVVHSPRSRAGLFGFGDFAAERAETYQRAMAVIEGSRDALVVGVAGLRGL